MPTPASPAGESTPSIPPDPRAGGDTSGLRLLVILSGIALAAFGVRMAAQAQVMATAGVPMRWPPMLATEAANWLGWTLWAAVLVRLVRRLVDRPAASRASGAGILLALAAAPVVAVPLFASPVHWLGFGRGATLFGAFQHVLGHNAPINLLLGATMVGVANGYLGLQRARRLEVTAARLGTQLAQAQLDTLRAQLDPHFLFNALNSIAVLARRGRVLEVEQMVTRLAGLLRHSLESSRSQLVTLRVELAALRHYLEIEQVRHGDRLVATVDVPEALHERVVPSFLLQPLVENAIRHGFTDPQRPLHLAVSARAEPGRMVVTVVDDGAGIGARGAPGEGVGLGHTRARLAGLHGGRASLVLAPGDGGRGTRVTITLPLEPAGEGGGAPG